MSGKVAKAAFFISPTFSPSILPETATIEA